MKLTVLGSGSAISGANRHPAGYVVSHSGQSIVLDLGFGCLKQLQKAGFDFAKINNLLFSHVHADHVNDLSAFCFARFVAKQWLRKPAKFRLFGPKGFKKFFSSLAKLYPQMKTVNASVKEMSNKKTKIGQFTVQGIKVLHLKNTIAYGISAGGKRLVYGADCAYTKRLHWFAKNADLLILECSMAKETPRQFHLTPEKAGQIASAAGAKKLMLTHFYPATEKIDCKKRAKKFFKGKVLLARDLLRVSV